MVAGLEPAPFAMIQILILNFYYCGYSEFIALLYPSELYHSVYMIALAGAML